MLPFLRSAGYDAHILFEPASGDPEPNPPDFVATAKEKGIRIVYFQKVRGPKVLATAKALSNAGVRVVYGVCDFVDNEMAEAADATIVVTDFLKSLYRSDLQPRIHVVHDGIERPDVRKIAWREDRGSVENPLRAVLVTSADLDHLPMITEVPPFLEVEVIGRYPGQSDLRGRFNWARWTLAKKKSIGEKCRLLRLLANSRIKRIQWNPQTVYQQMAAADIGIIPVETLDDPVPGARISWWQVKSENRLTMKMNIGLPVIAGPVPSYLSVIDQGRNGYIAETPEEWIACLDQLRDPKLRRDMGERARDSVLRRFSKERQAERLLAILDGWH
jgi:glycosyltransferase involved in cell wall biosynthesis